MNTTKNLPRLAAVIAVSLLALTGCTPESSTSESASRRAGETVTIEDAWVKSADEGMSAAFGTLLNSGDDDVTVVSVTSEASDMIELHETVENEAGEMVMREKDGGFVIPAGGKLALEPGANHIMLMGLSGPLTAGSDVTFTLTFKDGTTQDFTARVKEFSGANESYDHGEKKH